LFYVIIDYNIYFYVKAYFLPYQAVFAQ